MAHAAERFDSVYIPSYAGEASKLTNVIQPDCDFFGLESRLLISGIFFDSVVTSLILKLSMCLC